MEAKDQPRATVDATRDEFLAGVARGIAAADRGELLDHDEVVERIERLLAE